jgi:hypothetical protein
MRFERDLLSSQKNIIFRMENGKQEEILIPHGGLAEVSRTEAFIIAKICI